MEVSIFSKYMQNCRPFEAIEKISRLNRRVEVLSRLYIFIFIILSFILSFLKIISRQVKKSIAFSIFRKYQLHNEYLPQKKQELKMKLAGNESVNILFL